MDLFGHIKWIVLLLHYFVSTAVLDGNQKSVHNEVNHGTVKTNHTSKAIKRWVTFSVCLY